MNNSNITSSPVVKSFYDEMCLDKLVVPNNLKLINPSKYVEFLRQDFTEDESSSQDFSEVFAENIELSSPYDKDKSYRYANYDIDDKRDRQMALWVTRTHIGARMDGVSQDCDKEERSRKFLIGRWLFIKYIPIIVAMFITSMISEPHTVINYGSIFLTVLFTILLIIETIYSFKNDHGNLIEDVTKMGDAIRANIDEAPYDRDNPLTGLLIIRNNDDETLIETENSYAQVIADCIETYTKNYNIVTSDIKWEDTAMYEALTRLAYYENDISLAEDIEGELNLRQTEEYKQTSQKLYDDVIASIKQHQDDMTQLVAMNDKEDLALSLVKSIGDKWIKEEMD